MLFLESFWFLLPALAGLQGPKLARSLGPLGRTAVSQRRLGKNKTIAAYPAAILLCILALFLQRALFEDISLAFGLFDYDRANLWLIGTFMGLGTVLFDHAKSAIKRWRRPNEKEGYPWWPWDSLDAFVGVLAAQLIVGWIGWERVFIIFLIILIIHPAGNLIGFHLGSRDTRY